MAKFVKVPIQDQLVSSAATATTSDKLVDSGQTFSSSVSVGDYIHNTTDDTFAVITGIDSDTTLSISADIMANTEDYVIYSATVASVEKVISAERFLLADQPAPAAANDIGVTNINYASGGADVLTITHSGNQGTSVSTASAFEAAILSAFDAGNRPDNYSTVSLPSGVGVFSLAIA